LVWFGFISSGEVIASPLHEAVLGDESITRVLVVRSSRTELFMKNLCFMNHGVLDGNRPNLESISEKSGSIAELHSTSMLQANALARKGCLNRLAHSWQKGAHC
jgi:hypothetical protein